MKSTLAKWLYHGILGWQIEGKFPEGVKKAIIVVGPHTSNWDFFHGVMTRAIQKFPANFLIKDDWIKKPIIGAWLKATGGVGVNRTKNTKLTDQIVQSFKERDEFVITITPEGTRKYSPKWKSGFWYIAKKAGVPLIPASFDYPSKTVVWGEPFYVSENKEADFKKLRETFRQYTGKHPDWGIQ